MIIWILALIFIGGVFLWNRTPSKDQVSINTQTSPSQSGWSIQSPAPVQVMNTFWSVDTDTWVLSCTDHVDSLFVDPNFQYSFLVHIEDDPVSKKDWAIVNMLASKKCDVTGDLQLSSEDIETCQYYSRNDLDGLLAVRPTLLKSDLQLMRSLINGKNECSAGDEACNMYFDIVRWIQKNNYSFPQDIDGPKIHFFVYKKLFPQNYDQELKKLFIQLCEKNQH